MAFHSVSSTTSELRCLRRCSAAISCSLASGVSAAGSAQNPSRSHASEGQINFPPEIQERKRARCPELRFYVGQAVWVNHADGEAFGRERREVHVIDELGLRGGGSSRAAQL